LTALASFTDVMSLLANYSAQIGVLNDMPYVQAFISPGVGSTLALNPTGGQVQTYYNVLDNSAGDSIFAGSVTANNCYFTGASGPTTVDAASVGTDAGGAYVQGYGANSGVVALQLQPIGGAITTSTSTLDNGAGDATFPGTVTAQMVTADILAMTVTGLATTSDTLSYGVNTIGTAGTWATPPVITGATIYITNYSGGTVTITGLWYEKTITISSQALGVLVNDGGHWFGNSV
jgi:hypothetical protein